MPSHAATVRVGLAFPFVGLRRQCRDGRAHRDIIPTGVVVLYAAWLRSGVICVLIR
jgi:hypothetical protein